MILRLLHRLASPFSSNGPNHNFVPSCAKTAVIQVQFGQSYGLTDLMDAKNLACEGECAGSIRASRVLTGALAGQSWFQALQTATAPSGCVVGGGADHCPRGAGAPQELRTAPRYARADFAAFNRQDYRSAHAALREEWAFWRVTCPKYRFARHEQMPVKSNAELQRRNSEQERTEKTENEKRKPLFALRPPVKNPFVDILNRPRAKIWAS